LILKGWVLGVLTIESESRERNRSWHISEIVEKFQQALEIYLMRFSISDESKTN